MRVLWRRPARSIDDVLAGSHRRLTKVTIDGQPLPVVAGSVTVDQTDDVRRQGTLTLADSDVLPLDVVARATDRREITVWLGAVDDDEQEHWWPQGIFTMTEPRAGFDAEGRLTSTVTIHDRSFAIKLASTDRRWTAPKGESIVAACVSALAYVAPDVPVHIPDDPGFTAATDLVLAEPGDDVWQRCRDYLASMGLDLHVDVEGRIVAPSITDPATTDTVRRLEPGDGCTLLSLDTSCSTADIVNVIVCPWEVHHEVGAIGTGFEAPDPVQGPTGGMGYAEDVDGPTGTALFGKRVRKYQGDTSVIRSQAHADAAAHSELINRRDLQASIALGMVPDPRLDVGQAVHVVHPDLAVDSRYRITQLTFDLAGGEMGVQVGAAETTWGRVVASPQGAEPHDVTEIVTDLVPVLRSRAVWEWAGPSTAVLYTQQVAGVQVGDRIVVRHEGAGKRTAIALLDIKPLHDQYPAEVADPLETPSTLR